MAGKKVEQAKVSAPKYLKNFATGKMAPNPAYDSAPRTPERVDLSQPQYPADFVSRLKGTPGNINAKSQLSKSKKYE